MSLNDSRTHVYYLRSGFVKEVKKNPIYGEQVCRIITKHSYLGFPTVFTDIKSDTEFISLSSGTVCIFDKSVFKKIIVENGKFAFEILSNCGKDNLSYFHNYMEINRKQIYGRVADLLIYMTDNIYMDVEFNNFLSREEMASMINTTRESVTRALRNFIDDGIISTQGHTIKIEKRDALETISKHG